MITYIKDLIVDIKAAVDCAKADQVEGSVTVCSSVIGRAVYSVATALVRAWNWVKKDAMNCNIAMIVASIPAIPAMFGTVTVASVVALSVSLIAISEICVAIAYQDVLVSNFIGAKNMKYVRPALYAISIIKIAIVAGVIALFA